MNLTLGLAMLASLLQPGTSWYIQLGGPVDLGRPEAVYDISASGTHAADIATLKAAGKVVICYFSAGTWESYRPDAGEFPAEVMGLPMAGWEDERWLDIRSPIVRDLMVRRIEAAKEKGCDGIDPDNTDGFHTQTGFPLTTEDQVAFHRHLASAAHERGMLIGLKNTIGLVRELIDTADFAIVESCYNDGDCGAYDGFVSQNKAVFIAHYSTYNTELCRSAGMSGFSLAFATRILDGQIFENCRR